MLSLTCNAPGGGGGSSSPSRSVRNAGPVATADVRSPPQRDDTFQEYTVEGSKSKMAALVSLELKLVG